MINSSDVLNAKILIVDDQKANFSYDVWGETVNTAWHMEIYGAPGCIQEGHRPPTRR
jgi:hypothetical protein